MAATMDVIAKLEGSLINSSAPLQKNAVLKQVYGSNAYCRA